MADLCRSGSPALEALLHLQERGVPDLDRRGQAAFLVARLGYHLSLLLGVAWLTQAIVPSITAESLALEPILQSDSVLAEGRRPELRLARGEIDQSEPGASPEGAEGWLGETLGPRLEGLFAGFVEHLTEETRLGRAAQWRLIADSLAMGLLEAGRALDQQDRSRRSALAILKRPGSPLYNKQLHFMTVSAPGKEAGAARTFVSRGGCCRYYTAPSGAICPTCVLEPPDRQRERLQQLLKI